MHLFDVEKRFMGGYAIVGGQLPLATGAGLAIVHKGLDEVVVCQMGDATTNIGAWHESLNIAALWKLPVIFLIVNNGFGMGTSVEKGSAVAELYKKACAFDIPGIASTATTCWPSATPCARPSSARGRRAAERPGRQSFRHRGHSVVDPDRYRDGEVVSEGRAQDPIAALAARLKTAGLLTTTA